MAILFEIEYRPCFVKGKKALFHKWVEKEHHLMNSELRMYPCVDVEYADTVIRHYGDYSILPEGCSITSFTETYGLVEFEDGKVELVNPSDIQFDDNKIKEFIWNDGIKYKEM